jgi:DNA repair exonuclease SbcCD nuclease subunit
MPPQVLYRDVGVKLLTEDEPFVSHKNVFIGGAPYFSRHYSPALKENLETLSRKAAKYSHSIVMIHQGTDSHLPKGFELEMNDIPKGFNYYAMGHVHSRIVEDFGKGKLVYPGSTELWSANELDDYKRNGKGFTLVDMGGDVPDVQNVSIEPERPIFREKISADNIDAKMVSIREGIGGISKKPLVYLDVKDDGFERSALHEMLSKKLSDSVLSIRVSYLQESEKKKAELDRTFDLPQIHSIIKEIIKDSKKSVLASMLFRSLSEGNEEQAMKEAETFFNAMRGKS